jgi:site-specific DNA-methyltransferase (adenine-specific)
MSVNLIHGDCLKKIKDLSNNSVDIVITDLPYGLGTKTLKWDCPIDLDEMWKELWRVCKNNSPIFMFADFKFAVTLINSQSKYFKYEIVWNKLLTTTPMLSYKRFGKASEYILVFYKKQPKYLVKNHHKVIRKKRCSGRGGGVGVYDTKFKKLGETTNYYEPKLPINFIECLNIRGHAKRVKGLTEKPVEIMEHLLKYYAEEGDVCLDICMGSGSTGEACKNRNVNFIGIELNDKHYEICKKRFK